MKKIYVITLFVLSLVISLIYFLPYKKGYSCLIVEMAKRNRVNLSYKIERASMFHVVLKNVNFYSNYQPNIIHLSRVRISFNPLGFIFGGHLFDILVVVNGEKASFKIKKDKALYVVEGKFKTSMISNFVDKKIAVFIKGFKGTDRLLAILELGDNIIKIKKLNITGDFELRASGFMKGNIIKLMGVIKIGKIKENFSI